MRAFYEREISMRRLENCLRRIDNMIYTKVSDLEVSYGVSPEPTPFAARFSLAYQKITEGQKWGELWDCAWFNFKGKCGSELAGSNAVLIIDIKGEGCLCDIDGSALQGLTAVYRDNDSIKGMPGKRIVPLGEISKDGMEIDFWVDGACNDLFGAYQGGTLDKAEIAIINDKIFQLFHDFWVLLDLLKVVDPDSARYSQLLLALGEVDKILHNYDDAELNRCLELLRKQLAQKSGDTGLQFYAIGHSHLDLAWLWPIRETKRKALRTFSTAIMLLEKYPDYIFGASQPQQFLWVKELDPRLYQKIKQKVMEGRVELQGAMWVEPDLNLTSGESMIRQIIFGKKFWLEEFGEEVRTAHLPDVFGFSGALPQILKKSGVDNFLTIKLSWNRYNEFPYHTFNWRGIDGTEVLAHMPPENEYNSALAPVSISHAEKKYKDKGVCDSALILYGVGDGGGGPGVEHLERLKRVQDIFGLSKVKAATSNEFFEIIAKNKEKYATYIGEMYLEKHQGTYTSQAKNKYHNRRMELLLRDAEFFATAAWKLKNISYPRQMLDELWKETLLYQFHDILPGSSIKRVYDESVARYEEMETKVNEIIAQSIKHFAGAANEFFNPNSFIKRAEGVTIAPYSSSIITKSDATSELVNQNLLESKTLRAVFNDNGELISLFDKIANKEILNAPSNVLEVYVDDGDAWDMGERYLSKLHGKFTIKSFHAYCLEGKFVREQTLVFGKSSIKQVISINDFDSKIDFVCKADWQETHKFLKSDFNISVLTDKVNCNCAFGNIKRSTLKNTPQEQAQDEICAHKYIDLSEADYGVALLNDCKYGYTVNGNNIKISLLRSPQYPGENADQGSHSFRYAVYAHQGSFENSDVAERAYCYNTGLYNCALKDFINFESDKRGVIVECIKQSEDGTGVIVRFAEQKGVEELASLKLEFDFSELYLVSLDERILSPISKTVFKLKPFEIITIKII